MHFKTVLPMHSVGLVLKAESGLVFMSLSVSQDTEMPSLEWALCCKEPESRARERAEGMALRLSKAPR